MKITIKDIAKMADTSTATVSRVVNNSKSGVGDELRKKILNIIEETGYKPNLIAKSMVTNRTNTIAFISPDIVNPFYSDIIQGIHDTATKNQYNVFLYNTSAEVEQQATNLNLLLSKGIDGVILAGFFEKRAKFLSDSLKDIPFVILDYVSKTSDLGQVYTDNRKSSYELTKHLLEMGHRKIGCIIGPARFNIIRERLRGYQEALKEYGVPYDPSLIQEGGLSAESAKEPAQKLLENHDLTAIYCFNDLMAYGVYQLCSQLGKNIPGDISIVGFDGIVYSEYLTPPLTTVRQPSFEIGRHSMEHLLEIIKDPSVERKRIRLENELILRNSVKRIQ